MAYSNLTPIQFLDWDTKQLGVPTARIILPTILSESLILREILKNARDQNLKLIYMTVPSEEKNMINTAKELGGILVDHKITYLIDLETLKLDSNHQKEIFGVAINKAMPEIETYTESLPSPELIALAFESGKYSRFRADPNITEAQFQGIYRQWITNSVNHTVADDVLVYRDSDTQKILGMITVGEKNQRGDIGLLAVDQNARGKHIGTKLIRTAQNYFIQKNYSLSQVVTQQDNIPACKLYEKSGYDIEKTEYFFHFWLN